MWTTGRPLSPRPSSAAFSDSSGRSISITNDYARLQAQIDSPVTLGVPGIVLLVQDGSRSITLTSGMSSLTAATEMRPNDRFRFRFRIRVTAFNSYGVLMRPVSNMRVLALSLLFTSALHAQPAEAPPIDRLRQSMLLTTGSINARWGIYVKSLATGEEVAINADVEMETMSTIKIPLMIEVMQQIHDNKFKLTDKYTLVKTDMNGGTGTLQFMDPGAVITVKDLITYMVVVSDNTATEVLYRMVGGIDPVNARMKALGFSHTRAATAPSKWFADVAKLRSGNLEQALRDGKIPFGITTPREMGRLLEMMERKTLVDKASSELMLEIMRRQVYRTRLPRYLGYAYALPHKTGDFPPYIANDVGVIEIPGAPVVMCVFNGDHNGRYDVLENAIGLMALDVRNYFVYRAK